MTTLQLQSKTYHVNGIAMNVVIVGEGPDILLVHGFPDSLEVWRHQIPVLVEAGFRVIAPDQRGFGHSEAPSETKAYAIENYVADLAALLETLKIQKVMLVGHDWAAAVCWQFCMKHPARVDRYVAISVGHPTAYAKGPLKQKLKRLLHHVLPDQRTLGMASHACQLVALASNAPLRP